MLTYRSDTNRLFVDQDAAIAPWWQDRPYSWILRCARDAADWGVTGCVSSAATSSLARRLCGGAAEQRWNRFLLMAAHLNEQPFRRADLNLSDSVPRTLPPSRCTYPRPAVDDCRPVLRHRITAATINPRSGK